MRMERVLWVDMPGFGLYLRLCLKTCGNRISAGFLAVLQRNEAQPWNIHSLYSASGNDILFIDSQPRGWRSFRGFSLCPSVCKVFSNTLNATLPVLAVTLTFTFPIIRFLSNTDIPGKLFFSPSFSFHLWFHQVLFFSPPTCLFRDWLHVFFSCFSRHVCKLPAGTELCQDFLCC